MWNLVGERILRERGALPKEEGDAVREYNALHEENVLSSWLREDGREKEERRAKMSDENEEERGEKRKRKEEKEENKTERVKGRCDSFFGGFSQGGDLESCGGLSWCDLLEIPEGWFDSEPDTRAEVRVVPDVIDVLVSPSFVVTEFCDGFSCCWDWGYV